MEKKLLLLLLSRPLLLAVLTPLERSEHAADRACIGKSSEFGKRRKKERGQGEERKVKNGRKKLHSLFLKTSSMDR